eukprot:Anaeramoba_ignava/a613117_7.p1 GENE.a613117_7~~a613117_7.p1  ORF type:complete len:171 (+),score=39.54 a613117_7:308-820(+)
MAQMHNEIMLPSKKRIKKKNRNLKILFGVVLVITVVGHQLLIILTKLRNRINFFYVSAVYFASSIGMLIFARRLLILVPQEKDYFLHKSIKKLNLGMIGCTCCFLLRFPILIMITVFESRHCSINERDSLFLIFYLFCEIVPAFFIFLIFPIPPRTEKYEMIKFEAISKF